MNQMSNSMIVNNNLKRGFVVTVLLVWVALLWYAFQATGRSHPEARRELLQFTQKVRLGDTKGRVQKLFSEGHYDYLQMQPWGASPSDTFLVSTPYERGAKNWLLYIQFKGSRVAAVRFRVYDNVKLRPIESPLDRT